MKIDPPTSPVSVDLAHATLLAGLVMSMKPMLILELGFGAGYTANVIADAIAWNGVGHHVIVDNLTDEGVGDRIARFSHRHPAAEIVMANEREYVNEKFGELCKYDMVVSDADHENSHNWFSKTLLLARPGGVACFHDVGKGSIYKNLQGLVEMAVALQLAHIVCEESSRQDERCERGWMVVFR